MRVTRLDRGDTIIEVLFAMTIFSMVAVGGLSLMNQGVALAQQALEVGLVRQQMDAQADALRYLNRAYIADFGKNEDAPAIQRWNRIVRDNSVRPGEAQAFDTIADTDGCNIDDESFALNLKKLNSNPLLKPPLEVSETPATYAKIRYDTNQPLAEGIWIQAVRSSDNENRPGFYDFHIRACWFTPGQARPVTLGTIVRLYEPRR